MAPIVGGGVTPVELMAAALLGHVRRRCQRVIATRKYHTPDRRDPQSCTRIRSGIRCGSRRLEVPRITQIYRCSRFPESGSNNASVMASVASCFSAPRRWPYVSFVSAIDAWPRTSDTTHRGVP